MQILTILLPILASGALAYGAYQGLALVMSLLTPDPLTAYAGPAGGVTHTRAPWTERAGFAVAQRLPLSLEDWETHLRWAKRGGQFLGDSLGTLVFRAAVYGGLAFLLPLMNADVPVLWFAPLLAAALPLVQVRDAGQKTKKRAVRSVPELAALVAAEMAANTPAEAALADALKLPGPLSDLLHAAQARSSQTGRPLLSHASGQAAGMTQFGTLREIFEETGVPALRAFAVQLDLAASTGVEGATRMQELSQTLADEYRQQVLEATEKLDDTLSLQVALFYFAPMLILILMAFFGALTEVL